MCKIYLATFYIIYICYKTTAKREKKLSEYTINELISGYKGASIIFMENSFNLNCDGLASIHTYISTYIYTLMYI